MTTFICRREPQLKELLGLPGPYAVAGLIVLGYPVRMPTRLRRREGSEFTTIDRFDGQPFTAG